MRCPTPGSFLVLLILLTRPSAATEVFVASPEPPLVLGQQDLPAGIEALAISPDGLRMAYARPVDGKKGFSDIVWTEASRQSTVTIPGTIRDLVFLADNLTVLGLQFRPAKKREGDTFVFSWDGGPKTRRIMRVPPSSNDLDRWPGGNAILFVCRNEIRTLLPPDLRSGPLFSFPGDNFAVTSLGSSSYVVVGQTEALFLLDLSVPSGRESMPVLSHQPVPARVAALADYPDGDEVLVRLIDGRLFRASFDPPAFEQAGSADRIAGLAKAADGPVLPFTAAVEIDEPETTETTEPEPAPASEVTEEPPPVIVAETTPAANAATEAEETTTQAETKPAPEQPQRDATVHQIEGRIVGAVDLVEAVVLLGPDNILREAARVQPRQDGTWVVDGLDPGRYRVQLDGGGDRILVAQPRFLMVDVGDAPTRAPEIEAVRSF